VETIRRDGFSGEHIGIGFPGTQFLSMVHVADTHSLIYIPAKEATAIRGKGHAAHAIWSLEAMHFLAGLDVPQSHGTVFAAGSDAAAIRGKGHTRNRIELPTETADLANNSRRVLHRHT
jgi:hypothetical protein